MSHFDDTTILITGGTGTFGRAFLDRLSTTGDAREIRIFSRDEFKQEVLRQEVDDPRVTFVLGDVRDVASVDHAMRGVDLVFHAAALKQVPNCEFFPMQAVMTNVVGSHHVIDSACRHGVRRVVCLSTDKAVQPVNAMGMTKGLMERVAQAASRAPVHGDTVVSTVRYGNVMASRGSVIPLFVREIVAGRPVPITVPSMTRFLLPLPDAIELVVFALEHGQPGDIFVRKSPAGTIGDIATALHRLFERPEQTRIIGRRHGEKHYETLVSSEELARAEDLGTYFRIPMDARDLNYKIFVSEGPVAAEGDAEYHSHNTEQLDVDALCELLVTLPEVREALDADRAARG
ncbi:MAG: polysaccharide biosynthesis protein [Acidobacteriota bacterium]